MNHESPPSRRNLKMALLAGTCLTTSASIARSATVIESTDFAGTVAGALASPLPFDTTQVQGTVTVTTDSLDLMAFTSLLPGGSFTMAFTGTFMTFEVLDSSGAHVGSPASAITSNVANFTGTVPADGKLIAKVGYSEGNPYTVNLTATTVPETNAAALGGLGLAAAALRRRRSKKSS